MTTKPDHTEPTPDSAAVSEAPAEEPKPTEEPRPMNRAERRAAKHGKHAGRSRREWEENR